MHVSGHGTRHASTATAQTPATLNTVCLMLLFSVWGAAARGLRFFGRGAWIAPNLTAVPQTRDKSQRKCRIIEDGTKRHGNLLVVWPILPSNSVYSPLFMV